MDQVPHTGHVILRILALTGIFLMTSLAWAILGGTILNRTHSADRRLASRVQSVWGSEQVQQAPSFGVVHEQEQSEVVTENGKSRTVVRKVRKPEPILAETSRSDVGLDLAHRQKGLLWYSTYTVTFSGDYVFRNPDPVRRTIELRFPLPAERAMYDGLVFTINGERQLNRVDGNGLRVEREAAPGESLRLNVQYKSQGLESWRYEFGPKVTEVHDFLLRMKTNFSDIDFPDNTLSPTLKRQTPTGWELEWRYANLLSGYQIAMAMPEKLQPGPLAAEISFFAPVSLFFYFFLMFLITTIRRIELHPMNYFFLAAAFFAFHLLLAYLVDHVDLPLSFLISAAISIGLVVSYLRLVTGTLFAIREAALAQFIYLVLFSYAFFFRGFTGLAITIGAIATLFAAMQATGRIRWSERFASPPPPPIGGSPQ
jgi:hypothetical protein